MKLFIFARDTGGIYWRKGEDEESARLRDVRPSGQLKTALGEDFALVECFLLAEGQKPANPKETKVPVNPDWIVDCAEELVSKFDLGCSGTTITYNEEKAQAIIKKHAPKHALPK